MYFCCKGKRQDMQEGDSTPQRGTLLRRAHELLVSAGQPVPENQLVRHLFGASIDSNGSRLWTMLLRQTLESSSLFEVVAEDGVDSLQHWGLVSWHSTQRLLRDVEYVVVDTETTGLRPGSDRVIEVAGVRLRNGEIIDSFQSLINPERHLPSFIVKFTGITPDMLLDAPKAAEILPDFLQFIEGAVLVGHNLSFDLNFLSREAQLLGQVFPDEGLDTIPLARRLLPGLRRFKLDMVADYLKIPASNRHRAMGDTQVTAAVFLRLLERAEQEGITTLEHLRLRLQLPVAWTGDITQAVTKKSKSWRADGPITASTTRPNGSLLLNPAWKRDFPTRPGIYMMKDEHGQVIYVGKAKNLKARLSSYYSQPLGYTRKMDGLLPSIKEIETRVLGSELEALLVESQLIKELQPAYNVQLRNYELYPFIKIDVQHPFPRVYATREVAADGARYFGPFRSRHLVDATIELIQKLFPIRTCTRALPPQAKPSDPCLRFHLGRCSAPCRGDGDSAAYHEVIAQVCAFLGGEREDLFERLRRQMHEASQQLNYERAAWFRDAMRSADEVLIGQRLITGAVEANNLLILYPSSQEECNELFLIRHGRLVEQRRVLHEQEAMTQAVRDLLATAATLGKPPDMVGQAEVDQINIISRWIHRHSDDRAFFPFQQALSDEQSIHLLAEQIWLGATAARIAPVESEADEFDEVL
jgi:DNA polymerase-3 subunit epsilon